MKKLLTLLGLLFVTISIKVPQYEVKASSISEDIDIYLIAGQSNAVGQTVANEEQLVAMDDRFSSGFENVLYYGYTDLPVGSSLPSDLKIENAKLGLGFRTSEVGKLHMGPEAGMAYYLSNSRINNKFGIIKYASGSSSIYDDVTSKNNKAKGNWCSEGVLNALNAKPADEQITGNCYKVFLDTVAKGLEKYKELGFNPIIKGLAWMQGEAECGSEEYSKKYSTMLSALIKDFRTDLGTISNQDLSELEVVIAKIPSDYLPGKYTSVVRNQQQFVDDNDAFVKTIDNDGFETFDDHHYVWTDMLKLGMNYAKAFIDTTDIILNKAKFNVSSGGTSKLSSKSASAGEVIESALIPNTGFELVKDKLKFLDLGGNEVEVKYALQGNFLTFIMPDCDITVEVVFKKIPQYVIDVSCENGTVYRTNSSRNPYRDEKVTFTFVPDDGYELSSLKINGTTINVSNIDNSQTYPTYTVTISQDLDLEIVFQKKQVVEPPKEEPQEPSKIEFINNTPLIIGLSVGGGLLAVGGLAILLILFKKRKND